MTDCLKLFYDDTDKVCLSLEYSDADADAKYPFEIGVDKEDDTGLEELRLTTAEAKALYFFLEKCLFPKLEND